VGVRESVIKLARLPHCRENCFTANLIVTVLEIALEDAESWLGIKHFLYPVGSDRDASLDANSILDRPNDGVVCLLQTVIIVGPSDEPSKRISYVDRSAISWCVPGGRSAGSTLLAGTRRQATHPR